MYYCVKIPIFLIVTFPFAGIYSRKAFERCGFEMVAEYLYADYEENGVKVLANTGNHRCVTLMAKKLPPKTVSVTPITEDDEQSKRSN